MRKLCLSCVLVVLFSVVSFVTNAQWAVTAIDTEFVIDFDNTVNGVNNGVYAGTGFLNDPGDGQLDADAWEITGMSEGDKLFGAEASTGDFARGTSQSLTSGGLYSYEVETGNFAFGMLPAGSDITPGYIAIKMQNNTGEAITGVEFSYDIWVLNWAGRSQSFNGEVSFDGINWIPIDDFLFTTPEVADATPAWVKTSFTSGGEMALAAGDYLYFRWYTDDVGGSGSRDRIAIDNIKIKLTTDEEPTGENCLLALDYGFVNDPAVEGSIVASQAVWYKVNLPAPMYNVVFSLCGSSFDTQLEIWVNCEDATYTYYNDDFCGTASQITVPDLAAGDYFVKVLGYGTAFGDYVLNITGATCASPVALSATNVTTEGADLSWSPVSTETMWVVEVGLPGFIPGTGAAVVTIEDIPNPFVSVTGLNPATAYQYAVKAVCGVDNESGWSNNFAFTTACNVVSDFPFAMNFDDATFPPVCWTNVRTAGTGTPGTWNRSTTGTNPTCSPKSGAGMARYNCYNLSGGTMGILVTPQLDFPTDNYVVEFWMFRDNGYTTYSNEKVNVYYNTENNLTGAELIGTVSRYYGFAPVEAVANQWYQYSFDLPGGKSGLGYIILEAVSQYGNNIFVDEMNIRAKSTETEIITYSLPGQTGAPVFGDHTIDVEVAIGTDVTALVAGFTLSDGASASVLGVAQESGVTPNDFTNPVTYVVTAEDGVTTADWVVSVTEATSQSSENDIITFSFPQQTGVATIDAENHTVAIEVQWTANIADLTPTITVSPLASIYPESGVARDFTNPVEYTVTAEDASEQIWTVSVSQEAIPAGVDCANAQVVTLPLDAPYADLAQTNCGMLNSYSNSCMGFYDGGEDFIYRLDVTSAVQVTITMDPKTTTYSGLGLLDGCPDTGACIQVATGSGAAPRVITRILQPGTYYLMVDTWAAPNCIPVFDLTITAVSCLPPAALTVSNITQGTADVSWTAQLGETVWNLLYGETGFDPLNEGTLVEGASNPYTITGLDEATTYQVYVQTDCGGSVTAWTGPQSFTTLASCPAPTGLTATNVLYNQANLQWNANTATEWNIEWGLFGFAQGTGTLLENVTDNPYLLEGLEALTQYSYYVQAVCGAEQSVWAGPYSFTTTCAPVTAFPFVQSFDDATFAPACWTNVRTAGTGTPGTWNRSTTGTNPTCSPKSGAGMARYNCYNLSGGTMGILVTPQLDFPTDNYVVEFWMFRDNGYTTYSNEKVNVYYNTENNLTGAELIGTVSRYYGFAPVEAVANQWYQYSFDLPGGKSGLGYIILEAVSQYGNNIFVDEMNIRAKSTETEIITYSLPGQTGAPVFGDHTIDVEVAIGTDVTALVAGFTLSDGASASVLGVAQESGVTPNDFTNPVTYVVTAEDGVTTADWVVSVTEATSQSSENDIITFSFPQQTGVATIDAENHTVAIEVQWTANIADLTPTITVSPLASIYPESGVARDFTNPVEYTVTAEDASEQIWTVSVSQEAIPAGVDCANAQVVTLPLDAPYADLAQTNCGMLNSYSNSCMGFYDGGEDFIYRLDVTSAVQVTITMDPKTTTYSGLGLLDGCPDTGACIQVATGSGAAPRVITRILQPGTYYLMVDTWAAPNCIPVFDLTITAVSCLPPAALTVSNITQGTADVSWTAQLGETVWNLLYGETGFDPLNEGTLVEGASNPYTITGLDEATTYQVYVQTDCGGSVTAWTGPQSFTTLANCPAPDALGAENITSSQADLIWTATGGTSLWNIEWGLSGFTQGEGTLVLGIDAIPYNLAGLDPLTTYSFYIQSDCSGTLSAWAGPYSFTTACGVETTFPIVETFESTTFPPTCWTRIAGSGNWTRSASAGGYGNSTASAYVNFYGISGTDPMHLISLEFDASGIVNPQLLFDYAYATYGAEYVDKLEIFYSTDGGTTFELLETMLGGVSGTLNTGGVVSGSFIPNASQWETKMLFLPAGTNFVRFTATSAWGNNLYIDNVTVQQGPTCVEPTALVTSGITSSAATVSWAESISNPSEGYDLYLATVADAPDGTTVPTVSVPAEELSYDFTGLAEETLYYVWIRTNCGEGDLSDWAGPVTFTTLAGCAVPTDLTATNILATSADLGWSAVGGTTLWNIEIGLPGFTPDNEEFVQSIVGTEDNPTLVTGLSPQTAYVFYVQADCGSDLSAWAGPFAFTTPCEAVTAFPFTESFDVEPFAPACWTNAQVSGPGAGLWNRATTGGSPAASPHSGAAMARFNAYNYGTGTSGILVTPGLDFPADNYQVLFWMYRDNGYLGNLDRVNVYYNTANNLTGATLLGTIHRSWTQSPAAPVANQWYEYTFDMPEGSSGVGYVVFEGVSAYGNNIFVDDVTVQVIPTCPAPMALTASGITHEEALLAWTENGSATSWNIEYGISGFTLGEGTMMEDVENPYLLQGLQELTTYSYYVQSDCADDDQSTWVGPYSFTTLPSCPEPTGLGVENIITNQADLAWVAAGLTDLFNIEWGLSGFVQGEGTLVEDVNAETYQLTGLEPNTSYSFYVQANCGSGDYSEWAGPYTFTTTCAIISEYPYFEGFNSATFPNCWSRLNLDGDTYQWSPNTSYVYEGSHSVAIHWNSSGNNDWLISPQFEITSDALILDFFARSTSASFLESFNVLVSTTGTNPADFTIVLENVVDHPNAWLNHAYTLADYGINQGDQIYVAIQCVSTDELYLAVDAFSIREPNTESDIITYSIPQQIEPAGFDTENHIIDVTVGFGTDLSTLVPVFTLSEGATASVDAVVQQSGVSVVDFTGGSAVYNVVAEDGVSSTDWTVNITVAPINTEANILTYGFDEQTEPANINSEYQMIYVNINWWSDITNLIADFTLSYGASAEIEGVEQVSGVTANNFDHTVYYDVTAEDGSTTQSWEVNVTQDAPPLNITCDGAVAYTINDPDQTGFMPAQHQYYFLVTLPTDYTNVRMMTCGSDFDTKLAYFASCDDIPDLSSCPANPAGNLGYVDDGGCGSQSYGGSTLASYLNIGNLSAGTYVAVVYGYGVTSNGNFQFRVLGDAVLVTDLALNIGSGYTCPVEEAHPMFEVSNVGETTVVAGETINFVLEIEEVEVINEDFVLAEDLTPGQSVSFETVASIDLTVVGTIEWRASINYTADENGENNVVEGFVTVFEQAIEFVDAENDTITVESWPYTITANAVVNPTIPFDTEYLWEGGETTNTLEVNEEGWYILTVITADCEYQDSVYIVYYNRIPQFDVNGFSLYPNPTAGLFVIDVTLPEQSNAVITITDALGRTIEVMNVSNTDTYRRQVDMSGYAEGVYNITLNYAEQSITKRVTLRK